MNRFSKTRGKFVPPFTSSDISVIYRRRDLVYSSNQASIKHLRSNQATKQAHDPESSKQAGGPQAWRLLACGHHWLRYGQRSFLRCPRRLLLVPASKYIPCFASALSKTQRRRLAVASIALRHSRLQVLLARLTQCLRVAPLAYAGSNQPLLLHC